MRGRVRLLIIWLCGASASVPLAASEWSLSDVCPAGFHQRDDACYLQSFYNDYGSLQESGVGGLKTGCRRCEKALAPSR